MNARIAITVLLITIYTSQPAARFTAIGIIVRRVVKVKAERGGFMRNLKKKEKYANEFEIRK